MIYTEPFVAHRRRAGQFHHLPVDRSRQARARAVRPRQGGGDVARLQPHHPGGVLGLLHGHEQCRCRRARVGHERSPTSGTARRLMRPRSRPSDAAQPRRATRRALSLGRDGAVLSSVPAAADLLAREHEPENQHGDLDDLTLWPRSITFDNYIKIFTDPSWYWRLHQLAELRADQHGVVDLARAAGRLRVFALSVHRRQAPVLLAVVEPHGASGGVRAAVLQPLFRDRPVRHAMGRGAGALPLQRSARGLDPRRVHVRRAARDRRDRAISTAIPSRASSSRSSCR